MEITVPQLPQDVVMNILPSLPIKCLIQLKCVSKPWKSLISDPHFAKLQLAQSMNNNLNCDRLLLQDTVSADCTDYNDDLDHVNHLKYPAVMKKITGSNKLVGILKLGGSCNGLICVFLWNCGIFLWNPTIREARKIPNNGNSYPHENSICGLGYDGSIDDYKVVKTRHSCQAFDGLSVNDFEILTLKSNLWRKVEEKEPESDYLFKVLPEVGIFLRGALHWLAKSPTEIFVILVFNVVDEKLYELVELPDSIKATELYQLNLINSGNSLFLFCDYSYGRYLEAWHLKEYGVKSSWNKIMSNRSMNPEFGYWGSVLHYTRTGKIVMFNGIKGLVI